MNETFQSLFGGRLKEARKALGLSQEEAANLVSVTREHWGRCERGLAVPGGEVLAALAAAGADVLYILTGQRTGNVKPAPTLTAEEETMLGYFRDASKEVRRAALGALLGASAPVGMTPAAAPAPKPKVARKRSSSTSTGEQVFHGQVGQTLKVSGNLDQTGISFFSNNKDKK